MRTCATCDAELPALARSNRRYCDAACRRRAHERRQRPPVEPELAPLVPITDTSGLAEAVDRATDETRLVAIVATEARRSWRRRRGDPGDGGEAILASSGVDARTQVSRAMGCDPPQATRELELAVGGDDPFREIDELRERRSRRPKRESR